MKIRRFCETFVNKFIIAAAGIVVQLILCYNIGNTNLSAYIHMIVYSILRT